MNRIRFDLRSIERTPDDSYGVYAIWSKNICIYVGKADKQSLRHRLRQHYANSHNHALNLWIKSSHTLWFSYESLQNKNAIGSLERKRIRQFAPLANIRLKKKGKDYGFNNTSV